MQMRHHFTIIRIRPRMHKTHTLHPRVIRGLENRWLSDLLQGRGPSATTSANMRSAQQKEPVHVARVSPGVNILPLKEAVGDPSILI